MVQVKEKEWTKISNFFISSPPTCKDHFSALILQKGYDVQKQTFGSGAIGWRIYGQLPHLVKPRRCHVIDNSSGQALGRLSSMSQWASCQALKTLKRMVWLILKGLMDQQISFFVVTKQLYGRWSLLGCLFHYQSAVLLVCRSVFLSMLACQSDGAKSALFSLRLMCLS